MSTYVNDLRLEEIGTGEASGTWGTKTNVSLELIGEALGYGTEGITTNADTHTSTIADGATDPVRAMFVKYTGTLDSACTITIAPNTINRMQFIENATSGSQNIIISQGSGANITIPAGDTKAVYLDGAGSGAAVVDAFASLNVVDLKVQDDLTVTDDLIVNGDIDLAGSIDVDGTANLDVVDIDGAVDMASTLAVTGIVTLTDDLIIGDGKTIGSASDVDAITIASNGQLTLTQTLIGTALDISGDIDIDGTTNLDVVDIDGAVDMATTLTLAGNADFNGDLDVDGTANLDVVDIDGAVDMATTLTLAGNADFNGDLDVDGTTNLDVVDIDGAVDMASTLQVDGVITTSDGMVITTADNTDTLSLISTDADANSGPNLRLYRNSSSPADSDLFGQIDFEGRNDNSQDFIGAQISTATGDVSDGTEDAEIRFDVMTAGTLREYLRCASGSTPSVIINNDSQDIDFQVQSDNLTHALFVQGSDGDVGIGTGSPGAELHLYKSNGNPTLYFENSDTATGDGDFLGKIEFKGNDSTSSASGIRAHIHGGIQNTSGGAFLDFGVANSSAAVGSAMRIIADGSVGIGTTTPGHPLHISETGDGTKLQLTRGGLSEWAFSIGNTPVLSGGGAGGLEILPLNAGGANSFAIGKAGTTTAIFHATPDGVTMPLQPAFQARPASTQTNIATGSEITVVFGTEVFDVAGNFASNTFTAPVTGKYQLNLSLYTNAIDTASGYYIVAIKTSNRQYDNVLDPGVLASDPVYWNQGLSVLADMDANDTAYVFIQQESGTAQTDVATGSVFSGFLAC